MPEESPSPRVLPPFPVDDFTLDQLDHALGTTTEVTEDGDRRLVAGDFTLPQLLDFLSGHDSDRSTFVGYGDLSGTGNPCPIYESWDPHYSEHDVLRALISEIRRLRGTRIAGPGVLHTKRGERCEGPDLCGECEWDQAGDSDA